MKDSVNQTAYKLHVLVNGFSDKGEEKPVEECTFSLNKECLLKMSVTIDDPLKRKDILDNFEFIVSGEDIVLVNKDESAFKKLAFDDQNTAEYMFSVIPCKADNNGFSKVCLNYIQNGHVVWALPQQLKIA